MSSSSKLPSIEEAGDENISNCSESQHNGEEDDMDEEEDIDFNPFLKESPSLEEASSSLSSDIEVLYDDVTGQMQEDAEFGEETVTQTCNKEIKIIPPTAKKRKSILISLHEKETCHMRENCESSGTDNLNNNIYRDIVEDVEDAISKRTRARYSLASFTLDELETFLQETDDEDDLHNVDDEEEYKKFLAAVLNDDSQINKGCENTEDEDEENDADFELELEEALESDLEENCENDVRENNGISRRPETRLNKRQKASDKSKDLGHVNRSLRPLLPNTPLAIFPTLYPKIAPRGVSIPVNNNYSNGFTPQQLVQLHCLIHEHVQLLIQVFSLSVIDPKKQHVATQVKDLISAAFKKREEVISWKRAQYPFFLFPPHTQSPSGSHAYDFYRSCNDQRGNLSGKNKQNGLFQTPNSALQVPFVNGPMLSVLDVAPLTLVGKYIDEVSQAVQECKQQRIESRNFDELAKEPLFPYDNSQMPSEGEPKVLKGITEEKIVKKTMAAALVEKTKKQSIALVPKEIAGLARRFLSMFNPALFPHIPPLSSVVNRLLFTDAEDELLALGLMECNSNWKAIQERYLPCKSKHQIFVRQKNRTSSKAPDNPIKAVRKMKASPLTEEEISRIQEGLKVFKLDWMSVWRYVVPYRDPSLLPRQWRIANGTQKSYKNSDDKKARRRLYESNRRSKLATSAGWGNSPEKEECQTDNAGGENNTGDDSIGKESEAYVHEAFLADWRPATSIPNSSIPPFSNTLENHRSPCGPHFNEQIKNNRQTNLNISASGTPSSQGRSQLVPTRYRCSRKKINRLVKLAPDLPPVNLPPSVRVISLSTIKSYNTTKVVLAKNSSERSNDIQHPGESHVPKAHSVASEKTQSDLQMHPLLFQSSGDGFLPYYPLSSGTSTSSSFNFFPHFQPQLNLSLLGNPHLENQAANNFNNSSKESTSTVGIDFHPLLQRSDIPQLPTNSELFYENSSQLQTAPWVGNSFPGSFTNLLNMNEKANEVDLDIHLSLSRSEFATRIREVDQPCEEPPSDLFQKRISNDNFDSGVNCEQSLPGIVMEQEELSDSEEEIGEHVEFECEEMDDSEGDEVSDSEQIKGAVRTDSRKQKISDALTLNLSSFPKNNPKISVENGPSSRPSRSCKKPPSFQNHSIGIMHKSSIMDLLALNPSKGSRKKLQRNKASGSISANFQKDDLDLNIKSRNNAGLNSGQSGKVVADSDANVNIETCTSL